jgi:hypothetical protein
LVVWHPSGTPANPNGLPLYSELIIYCPKYGSPTELVEITAPSDTRTVPAVTDTTTWLTEIAAIKKSSSSQVVSLTNLMRSCSISSATGAAKRGAVRFETRLKPSQTDVDKFTASTVTWQNMPWTQGLYGWQAGMRQVWVRMELQLKPLVPDSTQGEANRVPVCFFGSAALYYQLSRE